jgi:hypothetical protein
MGGALTTGTLPGSRADYGTNWLTRAITERTQSAVIIVFSVRYRGIAERIPLALPGMGSFFHLGVNGLFKAREHPKRGHEQ